MSKGQMMEVLHKLGQSQRLDQLSASLQSLETRVGDLNAQVEEIAERIKGHHLWKLAAEKVEKGANLKREEAAAYLCVSVRSLQRMEAEGEISRCRGLRGAVRFGASDVLRLASAGRKGS